MNSTNLGDYETLQKFWKSTKEVLKSSRKQIIEENCEQNLKIYEFIIKNIAEFKLEISEEHIIEIIDQVNELATTEKLCLHDDIVFCGVVMARVLFFLNNTYLSNIVCNIDNLQKNINVAIEKNLTQFLRESNNAQVLTNHQIVFTFIQIWELSEIILKIFTQKQFGEWQKQVKPLLRLTSMPYKLTADEIQERAARKRKSLHSFNMD